MKKNTKEIKINKEKFEEMKENKVTNETSNEKIELNNEKVETKPKLTKKQEWTNAIKFFLFSISAGVIQILSFTLLSELVFMDANNEYGISYFISLTLSVIWNFTFNRKFTFKSAKNVPIAMLLVFVFYCAFTPLSIWWGIALTDSLGWNKYLVLGFTMIINFITEYLWTRYVVYRDDINTASKKEKKVKQKTEQK